MLLNRVDPLIHAPHQTVNFVALPEQEFGKITPVLPRQPCD